MKSFTIDSEVLIEGKGCVKSMVKRLISANPSEISQMTASELKQSIKASDGRVILSENVVLHEPIVGDITATELARAFGADMILLNGFDMFQPQISGLYGYGSNVVSEHTLEDLQKLVHMPIGLNLEPVDKAANMTEGRIDIPKGRCASVETFKKASELGFDFVLLTGNPGVGVTNEAIIKAVSLAKEHFSGLVIAGKMHSAGVDEPVVSIEAIKAFIKAGADMILVPAVGTVPGVRDEHIIEVIDYAHKHGVLVISAIGTSQESSDEETIRQIGLHNKMLGVDIQHIGDANMGLVGIRNIQVLSDAIRGSRHTVSRMARSVNR